MKVRDIPYRIFEKLPLPVYPYRQYMHRKKCIFIHIPKCAGTSVLNALGHKRGRDHVEVRHYLGSNPIWFDNYFKFTICRHPADRLRSAFNYAISGGNRSSADLLLQKHLKGTKGLFNNFCEEFLTEQSVLQYPIFMPQWIFVHLPESDIAVDAVLRFERLADDWKQVSKKINVSENLPLHNKARENIQSAVLSKESLINIERIYKRDYELFGYEMGSYYR
ncbi:sulfotransferase family 2 domain-containing protein [Alteromonas facilis]|uniref:sulfotransferase family 2 domain-containing protein n=1 Tax=Alteromonas facilis TaxID=2048004 RepID=UPI000C2858A5|nr:sulfotransferase family 2 domain-containing protein [Alteromonas facilis]